MNKLVEWGDDVVPTLARRVLGDRHYDWSVQQGRAHCERMAQAAWDCNDAAKYAAYRAAALAAKPTEGATS